MVLIFHLLECAAFLSAYRNVFRRGYCQHKSLETSDSRDGSSAQQLRIEKLVETDRILAINKPAGIPHHDRSDSRQLGIVNMLRQQLGADYQRIYGVHRLDAVTSGILMFAKDSRTAGLIQRAFREKQVTKFYIGISAKKPKKKQGLISGYMERSRRSGWMLRRTLSSGEDDTTSFASTRFYTAGIGHLSQTARTLILFQPLTGKTHQLRVAAKALGMPLLGDPIYAPRASNGEKLPGRAFLHAAAIHMPSIDGATGITVWSPPPFSSVLSDLGLNEVFQDVVVNLVEKHCACPLITEAIRSSN